MGPRGGGAAASGVAGRTAPLRGGGMVGGMDGGGGMGGCGAALCAAMRNDGAYARDLECAWPGDGPRSHGGGRLS